MVCQFMWQAYLIHGAKANYHGFSTQIDGIGNARAAELLLELGITSLSDLAVADEEAVAEACGVSVTTAGAWILTAAEWWAAEEAEIAAAMSRGCCG